MQKLLNGSLLGLFTATLLSGCALNSMIKKAKDQAITVVPAPLELAGDSVRFRMEATLPAGLLRKNKVYSLKPTYKFGDQRTELPELVFKAKDYPKGKQITGSRTYAFAYTEGQMDKGLLLVQGTASNINGKGKKTPEIEIAKGLITTPRLVDYNQPPAQVDFGYNAGDELEPTTVDFFFEQGKSTLRPSEVKSTRGQFLDNFIAAKNVTKTVAITGSHSPEGREAKNVSLSEDRAKVIQAYYKMKMADFAYGPKGKPAKRKKGKPAPGPAVKDSNAVQFVTKSLIEDWRPFADTLNAYAGFSAEEKNQILSIVNGGTGSFAEKELQLQALPTYPKLFTEVYPKLRFAQTEILTLRPKKSEAEIVLLAKEAVAGNAESLKKLNEKELAYAATLSADLNEKEAIYRASIRKNDMWQSHNNLGAIVIAKAQKATGNQQSELLAAAKINLAISVNKQPNAFAYANMAIAEAMLGNLAGAKDNIAKAEKSADVAQVSAQVNAVKGAIAVREGNYTNAIQALTAAGNTPASAFNLGLALLMTRDYAGASAAFNRAQQAAPGMAKYAYGQALAASRQKQAGQAATALKQAFGLDASLKQKALTDAEFTPIAGNDAFVNALK